MGKKLATVLAAVVATGHQGAVVQTGDLWTQWTGVHPPQPAPCYWSCLTTATGAGQHQAPAPRY